MLWTDPRVLGLKNKLSFLFYIGLLCCCDDHGCFLWDTSYLSALLHFRVKEINIYFEELLASGLISKNDSHGSINNWDQKKVGRKRSITVKELPKKKRVRVKKEKTEPKKGKTIEIWEAYTEAMIKRYKVAPLNSAKSRAVLSQLIDRVGKDVAVDLLKFYFDHPMTKYVTNGHPLHFLLMDSEWLYTQMKNNRVVTDLKVKEYREGQMQLDMVDEMSHLLKKERGEVDF